MGKYFSIIAVVLLVISCNRIETESSLSEEDIAYIKSLKLLDDGEHIYKFYSEYKNEVAGNFFTNRRVATYWTDERNSKKNIKEYAYYKYIVKIDTVYKAGLTYSPYALVTKSNGHTFKLSVGGGKEQIKSFFEDMLKEWRKQK